MPSDTETATTRSGDEESEGSGGAFSSGESPRVREYFDLRDALAGAGCPVCARVLRAGQDALRALAEQASRDARERKRPPLSGRFATPMHGSFGRCR